MINENYKYIVKTAAHNLPIDNESVIAETWSGRIVSARYDYVMQAWIFDQFHPNEKIHLWLYKVKELQPTVSDNLLSEIKEIRRFFYKGSPVTTRLDDLIEKYDRIKEYQNAEHNYFDNFCLQVPKDIVRHPDGTPVTGFRSDEELSLCRDYLKSILNEGEYERLTGSEKEKLILQWRSIQAYKARTEDEFNKYKEILKPKN